jgi:hypothetical protein
MITKPVLMSSQNPIFGKESAQIPSKIHCAGNAYYIDRSHCQSLFEIYYRNIIALT